MGSSDFVQGEHYSYAETPNDTTLSDFSIERDREHIIPVLQDILAINPDIKIMGSPWSPPGWMKTSGQFVCGSHWDSRLKTEMYSVYADYFIRFIQEYAIEGIQIHAITIQNEPLYCPWDYPGLYMPGDQQRDFISSRGTSIWKARLSCPKSSRVACMNAEGYRKSLPQKANPQDRARKLLCVSS